MSGLVFPTAACLASSLILTSCLTPPPVASPVSNQQVAPNAINSATLEGYALQIDGQNTRSFAGSVEIPLGCHVVVSSKDHYGGWAASRASAHYGISPEVARTRYFRFTAKPRHRYVIERTREYIPSAGSGRGLPNFFEVRTLAELDEYGVLRRRYFESEEIGVPTSC